MDAGPYPGRRVSYERETAALPGSERDGLAELPPRRGRRGGRERARTVTACVTRRVARRSRHRGDLNLLGFAGRLGTARVSRPRVPLHDLLAFRLKRVRSVARAKSPTPRSARRGPARREPRAAGLVSPAQSRLGANGRRCLPDLGELCAVAADAAASASSLRCRAGGSAARSRALSDGVASYARIAPARMRMQATRWSVRRNGSAMTRSSSRDRAAAGEPAISPIMTRPASGARESSSASRRSASASSSVARRSL